MVPTFSIAGLLFFVLRARRSVGAYGIPAETGLLIPPGKFFFRSVETQPYFKRGAILSSAGKSGMWGRPLRVNQAGIVPCSRATTALAWCCILLLSKRFV